MWLCLVLFLIREPDSISHPCLSVSGWDIIMGSLEPTGCAGYFPNFALLENDDNKNRIIMYIRQQIEWKCKLQQGFPVNRVPR